MAKDPGLEAVEVRSEGRAEELFRLLALPSTFHSEVQGGAVRLACMNALGAESFELYMTLPLFVGGEQWLSGCEGEAHAEGAEMPGGKCDSWLLLPLALAAGRPQQAAALQGSLHAHGAGPCAHHPGVSPPCLPPIHPPPPCPACLPTLLSANLLSAAYR